MLTRAPSFTQVVLDRERNPTKWPIRAGSILKRTVDHRIQSRIHLVADRAQSRLTHFLRTDVSGRRQPAQLGGITRGVLLNVHDPAPTETILTTAAGSGRSGPERYQLTRRRPLHQECGRRAPALLVSTKPESDRILARETIASQHVR